MCGENVEFFIVKFNGRWSNHVPQRWIYDTYKFVSFDNAIRFFEQAQSPKDLQVKYSDCKYIFSLSVFEGLDKLRETFKIKSST